VMGPRSSSVTSLEPLFSLVLLCPGALGRGHEVLRLSGLGALGSHPATRGSVTVDSGDLAC
jgi:hypothetical protein